jgi:hypothetical protein
MYLGVFSKSVPYISAIEQFPPPRELGLENWLFISTLMGILTNSCRVVKAAAETSGNSLGFQSFSSSI